MVNSIIYRPGTVQTDYQVGELNVHVFENTMGVQSMVTEEHTVFMLDAPVTTTDIWEGERLAQRRWEPGDIIFLPANTEVQAPYVSNQYKETAVRVPHSVFRNALRFDFAEDEIELRYAIVPRERTVGTVPMLREIARLKQPPKILVEAATTAICACIACTLSSHVKKRLELLEKETKSPPKSKIQRAIEFIEIHHAEPITLGDMAAAAAMSTFHFSRTFKSATGTSPMRYLWNRRVSQAKHMLANSDLSVVCVGMACGFSSASHFASAFKQATGVSPSQFRRSIN